MKVALVHELLTMRGGAERVLRIIADMFPNAPIYTLLYDEQKLGDWFPRDRVQTSHLQNIAARLPLGSRRFNHHLYLPYFPKAAESWDFSEYDLVISSSSAFAHGIISNRKPKHLSYIHSPARYLWDRTHDVIHTAGQSPLGPLKKMYLRHIFHKLRIWDSEAADRADMLLSASRTVQRRIECYWRRESDVLYPPIDDEWLEQDIQTKQQEQSYYLVVSTLVSYKRIELAIEACNQLNVPLKIVGEGPALHKLEQLAGANIEFLGYQDRDALTTLYTNAKATLFPGDEDFGLVPLESMACGTPVIAYRSGGALETVQEGLTGAFFDTPDATALAKVMTDISKTTFSASTCRKQAMQFSSKQFTIGLQDAIGTLMSTV